MQGQSWHEEEEHEHHAELDEKQQHQSSKFFLVDFEEMRGPGRAGVPKQDRRAEIEQCEQEADDKSGQEKVSEENDFVAVHATIIYTSDGRSNHKWLRRVDSLKRCRFAKTSACQGSVQAKASASGSTFGCQAFPAMQFKACKSHFMSSKEAHDHKKHWNAPARDLPDSCRNHHALSCCDPGDRDGNPGAGGGHFDSNWQINRLRHRLSR